MASRTAIQIIQIIHSQLSTLVQANSCKIIAALRIFEGNQRSHDIAKV